MDDSHRFARGAAGERSVAAVLERLRPTFGYGLLHDVLLDFNGHTTQIDHVLVDKFGILVVETKNYGALLRGASGDHNWTACYPNGTQRQMYNPLKQNDGHRKWLGKLLIQHGRDLPESYIQSLVVFNSGEIRSLDLSGVDPLRVITRDALPEFVASRYEFNPNPGQLGPEASADLYDFVYSMNRSMDPIAVAKHVAEVRTAKAGGRRDPRRPARSAASGIRRWPPQRRTQGRGKIPVELVRYGLMALFTLALVKWATSCSSVIGSIVSP